MFPLKDDKSFVPRVVMMVVVVVVVIAEVVATEVVVIALLVAIMMIFCIKKTAWIIQVVLALQLIDLSTSRPRF